MAKRHWFWKDFLRPVIFLISVLDQLKLTVARVRRAGRRELSLRLSNGWLALNLEVKACKVDRQTICLRLSAPAYTSLIKKRRFCCKGFTSAGRGCWMVRQNSSLSVCVSECVCVGGVGGYVCVSGCIGVWVHAPNRASSEMSKLEFKQCHRPIAQCTLLLKPASTQDEAGIQSKSKLLHWPF